MAKTAALPKYVQVSEMLIRDIAAGHLVDGAKLPPERDMADELDVAIGTLRKALADVESKGMLARVQGSGSYIRHQTVVDSVYAFFRLELLRGGGLPTAEVLSVDRLPKPAEFPPFGADVEGHRIRRLRFLDGQVIALEEIWLDGECRDVISAEDLSESLYHFYRHDLGIVIAAAEDRVGLATVPDWTPAGFHLPAGQVTGFIDRIGRTAVTTAVEYSRTWFDADRARYVSRMGKG